MTLGIMPILQELPRVAAEVPIVNVFPPRYQQRYFQSAHRQAQQHYNLQNNQVQDLQHIIGRSLPDDYHFQKYDRICMVYRLLLPLIQLILHQYRKISYLFTTWRLEVGFLQPLSLLLLIFYLPFREFINPSFLNLQYIEKLQIVHNNISKLMITKFLTQVCTKSMISRFFKKRSFDYLRTLSYYNVSHNPIHDHHQNNIKLKLKYNFQTQNKGSLLNKYTASLDQSTTSTKFSIFTCQGKLVSQCILEHKQICPEEGFLEHDPFQIMENVQKCIQNAVQKAKQADSNFKIESIKGIGICNQRETIICWDQNGKPYYNAIVWCDTRSKQICEQFRKEHGEFKSITGLPISTYFSMFKIKWLIKNIPEVASAIKQDKIKFGTIDTWVVYNLTGQYVTDASNASRTYLCNIGKGEWEPSLIDKAGIKEKQLPTIVDSFKKGTAVIRKGALAGIAISSILGDQQSSAYSHGLKTNEVKITYGTGCFLIASIGQKPIIHESFITTILNKNKGKIQYGFQCSVEAGGGTLNWAKRTGFFQKYDELNKLRQQGRKDLFFFPSFGQIYAPFWKNNVKGGLVGLSLATTQQNILYAILESIIFRLKDNLDNKVFQNVHNIYGDGGMTTNDFFMQFQSDALGKNIEVRQRDTCWGVAKGVLTADEIEVPPLENQKLVTFRNNKSNKLQIEDQYLKWCQQRNRFYGWQ